MTTAQRTTASERLGRRPADEARPRAGAAHTADSRTLRLTLAGLFGFVGLGGLFGGIQMLADPYHPMGMTTHMISRTPFDTFVVPGLLLMVLLGVVPLLLAVMCLRTNGPPLRCSAALGAGLMAWIAAQWVLVDVRLWLQPVLFAVGVATVAVAIVLWQRRREPSPRR